jgi:hypothetical protein
MRKLIAEKLGLFTIPTADGSSGQILQTDGNGNLSFVTNGAFAPVIAIYESNAGQTITNATATVIDFDTVVTDPLSTVTTGSGWNFEAPYAGFYAYNIKYQFQAVAWAAGDLIEPAAIRSIGPTAENYLDWYIKSAHSYEEAPPPLAGVVQLAAGETFWASLYHNRGGNISLVTGSPKFNQIQIWRVG